MSPASITGRSVGLRGGLIALLSLLALVACSSTNKADKPTPLTKMVNRIEIKRVWHTSLGGEAPKLRLGLDVAASGQRVFAASYKGEVEAFELGTGRRLWARNLKVALAGGPAVGNDLVVLGGSKGDVVALSQADGKIVWRTRINSEILAAPAVGDDVVVVSGVDGKMHGLQVSDGSETWLVDQQVPRLSLRGSSPPLLSGDLAIGGFDNGRVVAVLRRNGSTAWDATVGQSRGSTELQRLIDVDGGVVVDGDDLFTVAYQGRVAKLRRDNGRIQWARDLSSYRGLSVDADAIYVSTADGDVVRLDRANGTEQWRQKGLARRQLTAPVVYGGRIVVADFGGAVHWLDAANGNIIAREMIGKKRVSARPVVAGDLLLVFSDDGQLAAYRTAPLEIPVAPSTVTSPVVSAPP